MLTGSEVKSLRDGKANLSDAYGIVRDGEIYLINLHISQYERASYNNHEPTRTRKLLLHKREIGRLIGAVEREGLTLVPLELYFKRGIAKVALALGKGKKLHDKREDAKRERTPIARSRARCARDDRRAGRCVPARGRTPPRPRRRAPLLVKDANRSTSVALVPARIRPAAARRSAASPSFPSRCRT